MTRAARWRRIAGLVALGAAVGWSATAGSRTQTTVVVVDGDTFTLDGATIRLEGIDAPEIEQLCERADGTPYACGVRAAAALKRLLKVEPVACRKTGEDRFGRTLGRCQAGQRDINREMVARGWAYAFRRYSTELVADEDRARRSKAGLWKGDSQPPWEWRASRRK